MSSVVRNDSTTRSDSYAIVTAVAAVLPGGPGGWIILDEPECHLSDDRDVVVPDLAGWRREALTDSAIPECEHGYYSRTPDWICEVVSPGKANATRDREQKLALYERERVRHYWLVDPAQRTLDVYRLEGAAYRLVATGAADETIRAEPFDAIELRLSVLWTP
jgi:Uma2 family endonuclease